MKSRMAGRGANVAAILAAALTTVAVAFPSPAAATIALGVTTQGFPGDPASLDAYTSLVGRPPAVVMSYTDWLHPLLSPAELDAVTGRGALPMITWEPWQAAAGADQPAF